MRQEPEPQDQQVVGVIFKGPRQEIRISLSTFRGRTFADLRLHAINRQGQMVPTRKGITVGVEQLGELEEAIGRLRDASDPTTHPPF
jgi:Transcriptional Coactivator p15 (PC4)